MLISRPVISAPAIDVGMGRTTAPIANNEDRATVDIPNFLTKGFGNIAQL
jgi:hypothetical protein